LILIDNFDAPESKPSVARARNIKARIALVIDNAAYAAPGATLRNSVDDGWEFASGRGFAQ
jgi:hypothetical protein